jgi:ABC-type metal ion transport system substrate-binding protein
MTQPTPIDITNMPELVKIAEEVEATKTPRELKRENKTVAVITPVPPAGKAKKHKTKTCKSSQ